MKPRGGAPTVDAPRATRWPARLERRAADRRSGPRRAGDAQATLATDRLERELEHERKLRERAEATAKLLAKMVAEENGRRRDAESHARITFAELSATSLSRGRPTSRRKRRSRRAPAKVLRRLVRSGAPD